MCAPPRNRFVAGFLVLVLTACAEGRDAGPESLTDLEPSFAKVPARCDASALLATSRDYYSQPQQNESADALKDMQDECAASSSAGVREEGWIVLRIIEAALGQGVGGEPVDGAMLANGTVEYMCLNGFAAGCDTYEEILTGVLEDGGIFAVRDAASVADVVSHSPIGFTDPDANPNSALWGIQTDSPWGDAVGTAPAPVLFYGAAVAGVGLESLQMDLNEFPNVDGFASLTDIHVGACYEFDFEAPHDPPVTGVELADRMRRNGTILTDWEPTFSDWCVDVDAVVQASHPLGSVFSDLLRVAGRAFLPEALVAAMPHSDRVSSTGGSPVDFSIFTPVATDPSGSLEAVGSLPSGGEYSVGENVGPITILAISGDGIPMERVLVTFSVSGNSGVPAGAELGCKDSDEITCEAGVAYGYTSEVTGTVVFPELSVGKAGGYTLCATGVLEGDPDFTFTEVCTPILNVKNAKD